MSSLDPSEFTEHCKIVKAALPQVHIPEPYSQFLPQLQSIVEERGIPELESFSVVIYGNMIGYLTDFLSVKTSSEYKFKVTLVVFQAPN